MIGIVAHTSRAELAHTLMADVGAAYLSMDDGTLGCNGNHLKVLTWLNKHTTPWAVTMEDDAKPIPGFTTQLQQVLAVAPTPIVSLYLGRQRPPHWQKRIATALAHAQHMDAHFIKATSLLHAVGYAIRTELLPSLLAHTTTLPIDQHISNWAKQHGHTIGYTHGSLLDHLDGPTTVQHPDKRTRRPGRTAWTLGPRPNWHSQSVPML